MAAVATAKDLHMGAHMYLIRLTSVRKHLLNGSFAKAEKLLNKYNELPGICTLPYEVDATTRTSLFLAELNLTLGLQGATLHVIEDTLTYLRNYIVHTLMTARRLTCGGDIGSLEALPQDCLDMISCNMIATL